MMTTPGSADVASVSNYTRVPLHATIRTNRSERLEARVGGIWPLGADGEQCTGRVRLPLVGGALAGAAQHVVEQLVRLVALARVGASREASDSSDGILVAVVWVAAAWLVSFVSSNVRAVGHLGALA